MVTIPNKTISVDNGSGFEVIPLLTTNEVDYLQRAFQVLPENQNTGFYTSLNHENHKERLWVNHCIKQIIGPKIEPLLENYEPLFGTFTIKKPGDDSELAVHLDWSVVDEEKHNAIGVWVPLCDVTAENGAFGLLEGSFQFGYTIRGSMVNFLISRGKGPEILKKYISKYSAVRYSLNAGTAIVYDMRTAHFSSANKSDKMRLAANLVLIPKGAKPQHYYKSSEQEISVFEVDKTYFLTEFLRAHNTKKKPVKTLKIESEDDIEEQHNTTATLHSVKSIDLRQTREPKKLAPISRWLNRIRIGFAFRQFMSR